MRTTTWTVKGLAGLAGVSVRTLHHYHDIGLLPPASVGDNGYRRYGPAELARLQQILFFRELGFTLDRVRELLDGPDLDAAAAYRDHRRLLVARRAQLDRMIATLDRELGHGEDDMTDHGPTGFDRFDGVELEALQAEARRRWGGGDAWRQSEERTAGYGQQDWDRIRGQMVRHMEALVADMPKGVDAPEVQAHIAGYRAWLRNFYEPDDDIFRGLAVMFVDDPRYARTFQRYHPDLPSFLRDAMLHSLGDRPTD